MFLPRTIATSFGPRHLPLAPMIRVTLTPAELHAAVLHGNQRGRVTRLWGDQRPNGTRLGA